MKGNILSELNAVIHMEAFHLAQAMNYCRVNNLPTSLLIDFGSKSLGFRRVYNLIHPENKRYKKSGNEKEHAYVPSKATG